MPARPQLRSDVVLVDPTGARWPAVVTGYDADTIVLSRPGEAGAAPGEPDEGVLTWTTPRGLFRVAVTLVADPVGWRATPQEAAGRTQRRSHHRLPMGTPVSLAHDGAEHPIRGVLVDVTEAALRATVPQDQAQGLAERTTIRAAFTLDRTGFVVTGTVLRLAPDRRGRTVDVTVVLDVPARTASDLRRAALLERARREQDGTQRRQ